MSQKLTRRKILRAEYVVLCASLLMLLFPFTPCRGTDESFMLEKGRSHFRDGEYYIAAIWLERVIKTYPATPHRREVLTDITRAYARSGHAGKAVRYLQILRKEFPEAADAFDSEYKKPVQSGITVKTGSPVPNVGPDPPPPGSAELIPTRSFEAKSSAASPPDPKVPAVFGGESRP